MAEERQDKALNPETIKHEMALLGVEMGLLRHGVNFLTDNNAPQEIIEDYQRKMEENILRAAERIQQYPDQRILPDEAAVSEETEHLTDTISKLFRLAEELTYIRSKYCAVAQKISDALSEESNVPCDPAIDKALEGGTWDDRIAATTYLTNYYFATHKEITPTDPCPEGLPEEEARQLWELVDIVMSYRAEHGGSYFQSIAGCFQLEKDSAQALEPITEITQKDLFGLPLSKLWQQQGMIAKMGRVGRLNGSDSAGLPVNVGQKTAKGAVIVFAEISDQDGKPIDIDEVCKGVQRAVANLIYEAGGAAALPIKITPQQIYRAYARLPRDATVTEHQTEEMEQAMDKLIIAPAQLDYTAQLERHTKVTQQDDFDYDLGSGKRKETLIFATKDEFTLRGQRVAGYEVYRIPILYLYSRGFGQIAWTPNQLLTGPDKPTVKETREKSTQNNARSVAMKQNILSRVYRMEQRRKAHKPYTPLIRIDEVAEDIFPEGMEGLTERGRRTLRKNMSQYLEYLREQGKISGFNETKERRGVVGYTVKL